MSTRPQESALSQFYALFPHPKLAMDLFTIVEGYRVDAKLRVAYPGIRKDMQLVSGAALERRTPLSELPEIPSMVEALVRHALGATLDEDELAPQARAQVIDAIGVLEEITAPERRVSDSAEITARLYELLDDYVSRRRADARASDEPSDDQPESDGDRSDRERSDELEQQGSGITEYDQVEMPPFMSPVLEELMRRPDLLPESDKPGEREVEKEGTDPTGETEPVEKQMEAGQTSPQGQSQEGDQASRGESAEDQDEAGVGSDSDAPEESQGGGETPEGTGPQIAQAGEEPEADLGEQIFHYDEWDHRIEDYRPAWCTLREQRSTRTQEAFVAATFHEFGGIVTQIRRSFQLMRPERLRKMRFQSEGDDLDLDGLVEHVVDRRARVTPTERVYIKRDKKDRDVTTAFLIDMSSSTDRKIDGRKRIMDIEKEGLLLMCEALEAIRDEYAIYGFSGNGRDDCQFYVVKELGERYDDRVKARIGGIYARQKTRMGPAIRHATKRLMSVDSNVKLMILVTDGKPYDSDTYQDNTYAQEDTKMALREARREKIHLFCVTVDKEGADYLPHMYSDANFVIIDDVRTLPQKLPQLYRRLTT
jgi:nitric oxide reductase activation protein